jgi:hypothetical protein
MSTDRDENRIVRSWLEEGVTMLPDRVLDAVLDQLPATPQRRAGWLARRFPIMNNSPARYGIVAAAVIVVALLGVNLLPNVNSGGPDPTPTPTETASPTPATPSLPYYPSPSSVEPGTYLLADTTYTVQPFTFAVPSGWKSQLLGMVKNPDELTEVTWAPYVVTHVYADACVGDESELRAIGPSVDDLITALTEQGGSKVSVPVDDRIGGFAAKRVDISISARKAESCNIGGLQVWANPAETDFFAFRGGYSATVYVADVNGERFVLTVTRAPDASAKDLAEVEASIASIEFQP